MGYIFISYSHKDRKYVQRLAESLEQEGFNVWIDDRMDYGLNWPNEIQQRLDDCDALILVMSPQSFTSKWVQNEINRALRKEKPIFPLLLQGDEPWLAVESTQYIDVSDGRLPEGKFYERLALVTPRYKEQIVESKQQAFQNSPQESAIPPIIASHGTKSQAREKPLDTIQAKSIEQFSTVLQKVSLFLKRISIKQKERKRTTSKRRVFLIVGVLLFCTSAILIIAWLGYPWIYDQFKRMEMLTREEASPSLSTPLPTLPTAESIESFLTPLAPGNHGATRIGYGNLVTEEIKPSGNIDIYTFEGKTGDVVQIMAAGTSATPKLSLQIQVFDPQGKPLSSSEILPFSYWTNNVYALTIDGLYSFTVQDTSTQTGAYYLSLSNISPSSGLKIGFGDVVEGEIALGIGVDHYTFDANAGDQVLIALSRRPSSEILKSPAVYLVDELGAVVDQADIWVSNTARIVRNIENNGKFDIFIRITIGELGSTNTGGYTLLLKNISSKTGIKLEYGATINCELDPFGDVDVYSFYWKFGEEPEIILEEDCITENVVIEVYDLEGNSLAKDSGTLKPSLTKEGTYTIIIRDEPMNSYYFSSCDYTLSFNNLK